MDDVNDRDTIKFNSILSSLILMNNVFYPTAASGHTLDLVITNDVNHLVSEINTMKIFNTITMNYYFFMN